MAVPNAIGSYEVLHRDREKLLREMLQHTPDMNAPTPKCDSHNLTITPVPDEYEKDVLL